MDKELLQTVANAVAREAAKTAAQEIVVETRAEIAEQFSTMKTEFTDELNRRFSAFFGEQKPAAHIVHHDRVGRALAWFDATIGGLATKLVAILIVVGVLAVVGMAIMPKVIK